MNPESSWWGNLIQNFPWILVPDSSLREILPKDSQRAGGVVWGLANSGTWERMPEGGFVHVEREGAKWTGGMPHDIKKGKWRHSCWQWEDREVKVSSDRVSSFLYPHPACLPKHLQQNSQHIGKGVAEASFYLPGHPMSWASSSSPGDPCVSLQNDATVQEAQMSAVMTSWTRKTLSGELGIQCGRWNL